MQLTDFESVRILGPKIFKKLQAKKELNVKQSGFDPELLYVECGTCQRPLIWEAGETTKLIEKSNLPPGTLNAQCMIVSEGCSVCSPEQDSFVARLVVVIDGWTEEMLLAQPYSEV